MTRILIVCAIALALTGCQAARERRAAREDAAKDQKCRSYGAQPGTDAYLACRLKLDELETQRAAVDAMEYSNWRAANASVLWPR